MRQERSTAHSLVSTHLIEMGISKTFPSGALPARVSQGFYRGPYLERQVAPPR